MDNLRVLRYFLAVAKEGSISGAAECLHMTQPTLSRQLMDLESQLGVKLLIRGNRKIALTEEGLLLRKRAGEILELVDKTEKSIKPEDLWHLPLITFRQTLVSDDFSRWFNRDFDKLNIVTTYNLVFNASLMVEEGLGYALCLDKLVNTGSESNLCFRPLQPELKVHLDIIWKKYQVFSNVSSKFLQRIQQDFTYSDSHSMPDKHR